jgi:hypothetical protein
MQFPLRLHAIDLIGGAAFRRSCELRMAGGAHGDSPESGADGKMATVSSVADSSAPTET